MKTPEEIATELQNNLPLSTTEWRAMVAAIEADRAQRQTRTVHIVFDSPPAHESGRFIETETPDGRGAKVGQWIERADGYWALEIEVAG